MVFRILRERRCVFDSVRVCVRVDADVRLLVVDLARYGSALCETRSGCDEPRPVHVLRRMD